MVGLKAGFNGSKMILGKILSLVYFHIALDALEGIFSHKWSGPLQSPHSTFSKQGPSAPWSQFSHPMSLSFMIYSSSNARSQELQYNTSFFFLEKITL